MSTRRPLASIWLLICWAFGCLLWTIGCVVELFERYRIKQYDGDGTITDRGPLAFQPRYEVAYPTIWLGESGRHCFIGRGFPPVDLYLSFASVPPFPRETGLALSARVSLSPTMLGAVIIDDTESTILQFARPIQEWRCSSEGRIWHKECAGIHLDPKRRYEITIDVQRSSGDQLDLSVRPCLCGGGLPPL